MRGVRTSSVALLLSLFMISTSVSASACDLSCWLHQAHSGCSTVGAATANIDSAAMSMPSDMDMPQGEGDRMAGPHLGEEDTTASMSMAPDMDMGTDHSERIASSGANLFASLSHSVVMPPELEGMTESFIRVVKTEMGTRAVLNHSGTVSSCLHEPCSQTSMSVSPPTADHSQPSSLHWMPTGISNPVNIWSAFRGINPESPPAIILAVDHLTTPLRI
jgi:hypothetical protein